MIPTDARTFLNDELPVPIRPLFVAAVSRAYAIVADHFNEFDFLNWPVGRDHLRFLRRVAVEYQIKHLIDKNQLPLRYRIAPNAIDNCRHLEIITGRSIVTISQVVSPGSVPRRADYRNNLSLCNQISFDFQEDCGEDAVFVLDRPYYILLTHGYMRREPDFICLGIPEPSVKGWITQINLLREPHQVALPEIEPETEEMLVQLKENVREVLQHGT